MPEFKLAEGTLLRKRREIYRGRREIVEVISVNDDGTIDLDAYTNSSAIGGLITLLTKDVRHEFTIMCLAEDRKDVKYRRDEDEAYA